MTDDPATKARMLRATSDQLVLAIEEVDARERRKRGMLPADPAFAELAAQVRIAAEAVLALARQEELTASQTSGAPDAATLPPIEKVSPAKELATILEEWRAVEQRLNAAPHGTPEAEALMAEFEQLRDRYGEAIKARQPKP
jgi:hypothetical protein